ncbi:hypothetical protein A0H81_10306 [Grifola frondosa]|uniref:Uncharacterized protein n=1 Tax=Grifola frondosa TaxID=5627 RepID=A0A1C7LZW8_GRIFR|nr:hypothetical protein A0H81_10306 [Grifola frondosa]
MNVLIVDTQQTVSIASTASTVDLIGCICAPGRICAPGFISLSAPRSPSSLNLHQCAGPAVLLWENWVSWSELCRINHLVERLPLEKMLTAAVHEIGQLNGQLRSPFWRR